MRTRINFLVAAAAAASILITSCLASGGAKRPSYPAKTSPEIISRYDSADALFKSGNMDAADKAFEAFVSDFEYNEYTDMAKFKRGEIRFEKKNCDEALGFYRSATEGIYNPAVAPKAHYKAAVCLYRMKRNGEAIDEIVKIRREEAPADLRVKADSLGMIAAKKDNWSGKKIVRFALFLVDDYTDISGAEGSAPTGPEIISQKDALDFVHRWTEDSTVTEEDMATLPADAYAKKPSGGYYLFKQALVKQKYGDYKGAAKLFKKYVNSYPKDEYYEKASQLLAENSARTGKARFKVGVILPLTGQYQMYAESVQHGVECALGIVPPCEGPNDVQIVIKDSQGNPEVAAATVAELAEEDVQAIIGPMLSAEVPAVAAEAQKRGIPLITISQREGITSIGDYIFRNSVTSKSEVEKLADYATKKMGLKRFAIYFPRNNKGEEFRQLFTDSVQAAGGRIVETKGYNPKSPEVGGAIRDPSILPMEQQAEVEPVKANYDALFIPGSASAAAYIASSLAMNGIQGIQLLGTMRWSESSTVKRGVKYLEGAVYVTALDKTSSDSGVRNFFANFQQAYNTEPALLEGLAYDSMRLILDASANGALKRESVKRSLADKKDFHGATGLITFDDNRDAHHTLKVMKIKNGQSTTVE